MHRLRGISQRSDGISLFKRLYLTLGVTQFGIDFRHAVVDELLGTQRHLVLVGIGLTVVANGEVPQHVHSPAVVVVLQCQFRNRGHLGGGLYGKSRQVLGSDQHRRMYRDMIGIALRHHPAGYGSHRDGAQSGLECGRKRTDVAGERGDFLLTFHCRTRNRITVLCPIHGDIQPLRSFQQIKIERIKMLRIEIDAKGMIHVSDDIADFPFTAILRIEFQIFHGIAQQDARLEDFHLTLNSRGIGHKA